MEPQERRSTNEILRRQIIESIVQPAVIQDLTSLVAQRRRWSIILRACDTVTQILVLMSLIASFVSGSMYIQSSKTMVGEYLPFASGFLNVVSIFLMRYTGYAQQQYNRVDQCIGDALVRYNISVELPGAVNHRDTQAKDKAANNNKDAHSNHNPVVIGKEGNTQRIVERFVQRLLPPDRTLAPLASGPTGNPNPNPNPKPGQ